MIKNDYSQELSYAVEAALNAGKYLLKNKSKLNVRIESRPKDTKLQADVEAENLIKQSKKITTFADDGVKLGKEFLTNSKVIKGAQSITKKIGPKLSTQLLGEITIVGGVIADISAGFYRLSKGDKTGAALSFFSAIPIIGLPVAAVDIARDSGPVSYTHLTLPTKRIV